jgi:hypothetical protein
MPRCEEYLGDGVYASFDPFTGQIKLDTRAQYPVNEIYIEEEVLIKFMKFVAQLKEEKK